MKENKFTKRKKHSMSDKMFNTILLIILTVILILVLYPIIYVLSSSFSSGSAVVAGDVILWPVKFSIEGYKLVFANTEIWRGYLNSIMYAGLGTLVHLIMTICMAYPLSRRGYTARGFFSTILTLSMMFGGGLIPTYILISNLGLMNTRTYMIIVGAVSVGHIVIMRTFFQSNIPEELLESAKMDGISDISYLLKIVLPLSKASISVISLYGVVSKWNAYTTPMIYLRDKVKWPLQLVARQILEGTKIDLSSFTDAALAAQVVNNADTMRYALIVVSILPMMILYPFVQKFFEKGVMIGSIKG